MRRPVPIVAILALAALALLGGLSAAAAGAAEPGAEEGGLFSLGEGKTVEALADGHEGSLWFAGSGEGAAPGNFVGKISSSGKVTEWPLPETSGAPGVGGLARGPEGSMWVTEPNANEIAWVTPTGKREWFVVPTAGSRPTGIVASPGGFLWVTMEGTNRVAQIEPASASVEEFGSAKASRPTAIAFGSDSALWAVQSESAELLRVSLEGSLGVDPLPTSGSIFKGTVNSDVVAGAEGNLWLSQSDGPYVGEIHLSQGTDAYTRYEVPTGGGTSLISTGPHRDIWFASGESIGSISPRGLLGEASCPVAHCPGPVTALAEGPEGGLWFAVGNRIGRFAPLPLTARLAGRPAKVKGRQATISVECRGGAAEQACAGKLSVYARRGPKRVGRPLARARFRVLTQGRKKVRLRLSRPAAARLHAAGSLPVQFVLKRNGDPIPAGTNYTLHAGR